MTNLKSITLVAASFVPTFAAALFFGLGFYSALAMGIIAEGSAMACAIIFTMWVD